jgi:hypothetical protein
VTTNVTLYAGHDVAYFTRGQEAGGCAGAMSYYTAAREPPGQWAGTAARKSLGLTGQVDAGVLDRLFMKGSGRAVRSSPSLLGALDHRARGAHTRPA